MSDGADDDWLTAVEKAVNAGPRLIYGSQQINRACDHICDLLRDAVLLFRNRSFPRSAFLAITALEETAKAHVGMMRKSAERTGRRRDDPLFQHTEKHRLGAAPTIAMGSRLSKAIGQTRVEQLVDDARSGRLVELRESSLYFESQDGQMRVPSDVVTQHQARELLLFAIEAFDDALVGYTKHSFEVQKRSDEFFGDIHSSA